MKERTQRVLRKRYLVVKVLFQICIVVGMVVLSLRPLMDGREIRLVVEGRDPRDLFRGDYVALRYEFSTLNLDSIPNNLDPEARYTFGDRLYLEMKQRGRFYRPVGLWSKPPEKNLFIKVVVGAHVLATDNANILPNKPRHGRGIIMLSGGIEEYYTNPESAKQLEALINRGQVDSVQAVAYVMVSEDGESRVKKVRYDVMGEKD